MQWDVSRKVSRQVGRRFKAAAAVGLLIASAVAIGSSPVDAYHARAEIWVGAPGTVKWASAVGCPAAYPSANCSLPASHHTYAYGMPYRGDWGVDLQATAGQTVKLYAAPQNTSHTITAKVEKVVPSCGLMSGETRAQQLARGGHTVVVGLYRGATRSGWVSYTHINPAAGIAEGAWINRWGTTVGTVGQYTKSATNKCWTGVHLHLEMTNEAHYSCYNRTLAPNQQLYASNFLGFVGGARTSGPRLPCP